MVKRIKNLVIKEVSIVDHPANPHAVMALFKSIEPDQVELLRIKLESLRATLAPHLDDDVVGDAAVLVDEAALEMLDLLGGQPEPAPVDATQTTVSARLYAAPASVGASESEDRTMDVEQVIKSGGDKDAIFAEMQVLALKLEPGAATPAQALAKSANHPDMKKLYAAYRAAKPARPAEPVAKAALPGDGIWHEIVARAEEERFAGGLKETQAAAIEKLLRREPGLHQRYREAVAAGR